MNNQIEISKRLYKINSPKSPYPKEMKKRYEMLMQKENIDGFELAYIITAYFKDKGVELSVKREWMIIEACCKEIL